MANDHELQPGFFHPGKDAEAIPPGPDEFVDPHWPFPDKAMVIPVKDSKAGPWFVEERYWPRFKREEVPTRKKSRTEDQQLDTREAGDGQGKCWTECHVIERTFETPYFMVTQYVERWRINTSLEKWYNFVLGKEMTVGGSVVSAAGLSAGQKVLAEQMAKSILKGAVGKQVATAGAGATIGGTIAAGAGIAGVGLLFFVGVTALASYWVQDAVRISAGWELRSDQSGYGEEKLVKQTTAYWKRCSEIRDCPVPQKKGSGPAIGLPGAGTKKLPMIWLGAGFFALVSLLAVCGLTRGLGVALTAPAATQAPVATRTVAATQAAIATALATGLPAAGDPCSYVTTAEASAILEKPVTANVASATQCAYRPEPAAEFRVAEGDGNVGSVLITRVVITVVSGREAASRFDARQALFGRDPDDRQITGLGDKAIVVGGVLAVLQGSSFISVVASGNVDLGDGRMSHDNTWRKYIGIMEGFARAALTRVPR